MSPPNPNQPKGSLRDKVPVLKVPGEKETKGMRVKYCRECNRRTIVTPITYEESMAFCTIVDDPNGDVPTDLFEAYFIQNVDTNEPPEEEQDLSESDLENLEDDELPKKKVLDVICVKCRTQLGWLYTDTRSGEGNIGGLSSQIQPHGGETDLKNLIIGGSRRNMVKLKSVEVMDHG